MEDKAVLLKLEQIIIHQEEMKQQQQKHNQDMEKVLMLLRGNPLDTKDSGLIGQVDTHETDIKKLKEFKNKGIWVSVGMTLAGGYGFFDVLKRLFASKL